MVGWEEMGINFAGGAISEDGQPAATLWKDGGGVFCRGRDYQLHRVATIGQVIGIKQITC